MFAFSCHIMLPLFLFVMCILELAALRNDLRAISEAQPRHRFTLSGTSDIFVSLNPDGGVSRTNCAFCVEVKRAKDMSNG
jgi:hypothetical protein